MSAKKDKFGYLNRILGKLGVTHNLGRLSIRLNWTFFAIYYGSGAMRLNVYSWAVFSEGLTSLHSNFTWTGSSPINYSWDQKTRDTGLLNGEDCIPLRSLILTQYWSVTDGCTDRRDGRICRSIYSACKASFAARCNMIKWTGEKMKGTVLNL